MSRKRRLPGRVWRIISFVPGFNWIALLYIGIINSKLLSVICALLYGILTYKSTSLLPLVWIAAIFHYSFVYTAVGRRIDTDRGGDPAGTSGGRTDNGTADISATDPRVKFLGDMKKYSAKEGRKVPFVPFMVYRPTYDSMDKTQLAWYFYWRSQVRQGNYMDTDLSYIFVYVYELLSGIGWTRSAEGAAGLIEVWTQYRERFPKLDRYLPDWMFDFTLIHRLDIDLPIGKCGISIEPSVMADVLIDRHAEEIPLKLPFPLIAALTDYTMENSKFYKDGNQLLIREAIPRVVALVDAILRKERQKGLLAVYGPPRTKKQERVLFNGAVCPKADQIVTIQVKGYSSNARLRTFLTEIIRYGENVLRGIKGCRGRLRGITVDEETAEMVEAFLQKEYGGQPEKEGDTLSKKEIAFDFDSINELREESDAVRAALKVEQAGAVQDKPDLTDLKEVTAVYTALTTPARELLNRLEASGWETKELPEDRISVLEINGLAVRNLGCILVAGENGNLIAEDDYRDELAYLYDNPPPIPEQENKKGLFQVDRLPAEMKEFVEALMPEQQDALYALLTSDNPQQDLERIAEQALTMPELLLDDINVLSMQFMGDLIVDAMGCEPVIMDEYFPPLKNAII